MTKTELLLLAILSIYFGLSLNELSVRVDYMERGIDCVR